MRLAVVAAFPVAVLAALLAGACGAAPIEGDLEDVPLPDRSDEEKDSGTSTRRDSGGALDEKIAVTVTLSGGGTGAITSTPSGITCTGTTCTGSFPKGTALSLTAAPAAGSLFGGWSGACTGAACAVQVNSPLAITAAFVTLDGTWAGTYTNSRVFNGCQFNNAGNLNVTIKSTAGALSSAATVTGLELRGPAPGCQLGGIAMGSAADAPVTLATDTLTGTWTVVVQGVNGTLALPFTGKIADKKLTGTWTCTGCTGSFSVTKP